MSDEYELIPEQNHDASSPDEESPALAAWRAFEQGALGEAPMALAAWLDHQRFTDVR